MAYISTILREVLRVDKIITIHYFEYMNNFAFSGEQHNFWEFLYVDSGEVEVQANEDFFRLQKGQVIFHRPMEFHAVKSVGKVPPNLIVISFESRSPDMRRFESRVFPVSKTGELILSRLVTEARLSFSTPLHIPSVEKIDLAADAPFGAEQMIKVYLEELLINLVRESAGCAHPSNASLKESRRKNQPVRKGARDAVLAAVLSYMEFHICETASVAKICNENLVGRSQLQDLFHKEFGCGVMEQFSRMKIEKAKEIIRTSSMNFSELSDYLSFRNPSYFSRKFRQVVGMSPSQYISSIKGLLPDTREINSRRSKKRS